MIKLVVFDLDNVIIDGEGIEEIGKLLNSQDEIAKITEKTMKGDLNFKTSIKERARLLKGVSIEHVKKLANKIELMEGAEASIKSLKDNGYKVAVISGSFDLMVDPLKEKLDLDYLFTSKLEVEDGKLTGEVSGLLVEGSKADVLNEIITSSDVSADECVVIGDGANDISIMELAKYNIAFNAKPKVKELADIIIIEKDDLTEILTVIKDLSSEADEEVKEEDGVADIIEESTEEREKVVEANKKVSKPRSKRLKKDSLPEVDLELAATPEGVQKQKDEREEIIAKIVEEREEFNRIVKEQRKIRDELNDDLKENLKLAIELRDKRNEVNKAVEESKKLRDEVNKDFKKLEWSDKKRDRLKLENEIKKIDKIIETRVLKIKKENELVKNANDLRKQLMEIKQDEKVKEKIQDLKKISEEHHAKVVELSSQAQDFHDEMINYFRKTDNIRTDADKAHKKFIEARKAASAKHDDFKVVLSELHIINKELGINKSKRRKSEMRSGTKKNREEKEKAEDIFEKFKNGKKLATEELLLLQKHGIG